MKKAIFMISVITFIILVSFSVSACNSGKGTVEIKNNEQSIIDNSKESPRTSESNKENIQNSAANEDESEFSMLYNPPEDGSPENIGKIIFCSQSYETEKSGDYYLYIINPDGSNITNITDFTADACQWPDW